MLYLIFFLDLTKEIQANYLFIRQAACKKVAKYNKKWVFAQFCVLCRHNTGSSFDFDPFLCLNDSLVSVKWP